MSRRRERKADLPSRTSNRTESVLPAALQTRWRVRALLLAITLAAYADSFGLGLAQDSQEIITKDARIQEASAENFKLILQKDYWWPKRGDMLYRPVTTASLLVNYAVLGSGPNPAGYHWSNFLLHAANAWLVYELALQLFRRPEPAFFAAALWAVHPIDTEAVTNIVGRADMLAAMSVLGGLLLYIRSRTLEGRRSGWALIALFAIATAGVFSKESAAVLIGLMLLWDLSFGAGGWRSGVPSRLPAYAAVAASLCLLLPVRHFVFAALPWPQIVYTDNMLRAADFWTARLTAIKVIGLELWLLICPLSLSCDRSYNQIPLSGWRDPYAWIAFAAVAAILAVALTSYRRDALIFWLAGFLGITLLPTSNLIFLIGTMMGERFLYLPSVAFAIAMVALAYRRERARLTARVLVAVMLFYGGRTFARNLAWRDNLTLASTDVRTAPRSVRLHDMLAKSLFEQDSRLNIDRAIEEEETAWAILSALPPAQSSDLPPASLGIYYGVKAGLLGSPATEQSRPWYEKSIAVSLRAREISQAAEKANDEAQLAHGKPLSVRAGFQLLYFSLANAYLNLGRYPEALEALRYGRNLDPHSAEAYDGMAIAYRATGKPERAAVAIEEKAQVTGFSRDTLAALRDLYGGVPDGACAVEERDGSLELNMSCARLHSDMCAASADLAQAFHEARAGGESRSIQETAIQRYGCAAAQLTSPVPPDTTADQ